MTKYMYFNARFNDICNNQLGEAQCCIMNWFISVGRQTCNNTNFLPVGGIWTKIYRFWLTKMHIKMSPAKWLPLIYAGLDELPYIMLEFVKYVPMPPEVKRDLRQGHISFGMYRTISNIRRTKSPNLNVSLLVLELSLSNPMKPGVKSRMKMWLDQRRQAMLQLHLSDRQFYCLLTCDIY